MKAVICLFLIIQLCAFPIQTMSANVEKMQGEQEFFTVISPKQIVGYLIVSLT